MCHVLHQLHDRKVSTELQRTVRRFFSAKYDALTVFTDTEYHDIFMHLPMELRVELARQLKYIGDAKSQNGGILSKVPSLGGLDNMSMIAVCSKLKMTFHEKDGYDQRARIDHTYIFKRGQMGYDMMVVVDGIVHLVDDEDARSGGPEQITALRSGDYVDEYMALLPQVGYRRRQSCYAASAATVGLLSAEDITQLRDERAEIDRHVRPFVQSAKRARYQNKIDAVFAALDGDGDGKNGLQLSLLRDQISLVQSKLDHLHVCVVVGWIDLKEFESVVKNRKPKNKGGNDAEVFFYQL